MTFYITSLCASQSGDITVSVRVCDGDESRTEKLSVSVDAYAKMGIRKGECDAETYQGIKRESEVHAAFRRGVASLGFCASSKRALSAKLISKGFDRKCAAEATERIFELGFANDRENAVREAQKCVLKLWGASRIRSCLLQKGYSADAVEEALFSLEDDGVDFDANCRELISKKYPVPPKDRTELQKLIASVSRYGYTLSQIKNALKQI